MNRVLGQRFRLRGCRRLSAGRAPPSVTISVSPPPPSVPNTNAPSDGSAAASINVAAAPSPKIVRSERSVG